MNSKDKFSHIFPVKQLHSSSAPESHSWEVNLGVESFPYLADHCFQEMIVLPGAFYVEMALAAAEEAYGGEFRVLQDLEFQTFMFLPESGSQSVHFMLSPKKNGYSSFRCYSGSKKANESDAAQQLYVSGKILDELPSSSLKLQDSYELETIRTRCLDEIAGEDFYAELKQNGNQYGPAFQGIQHLWKGDREALARVRIPKSLEPEFHSHNFHPVLLDSCTQLLTAANIPTGRTFFLLGFEQIHIFASPTKGCWSHAYLEPNSLTSQSTLKGNVRLYDTSGQPLLELLGVTFQYLDYDEQVSPDTTTAKSTIAVAATFTAEPLEESLNFWTRQLQIPFQIDFAPYNQIFQELLDPSSLISNNTEGFNIILLCFEDWLRQHKKQMNDLQVDDKEVLLGNKKRYTLPNNLEIAHINDYETEYLFKEMYLDQTYLRHGIKINDGDCIVDVGANIGLFTLFVQQKYSNTMIYAFEPSPPAYEALNINASLYGSNVEVFDCGLSNEIKEAPFTYYEKSSVFSTFSADEQQDEESIRAVILNMLRQNITSDTADLEDLLDELMEDRLASKSFICQLTTLSNIIEEKNIEKIDLLKIDAEKSELNILKGIDNYHWDRIKQIVIEVHDKEGSLLEDVKQLLQKNGFNLVVDEEDLLKGSGLYTVYSTRTIEREEPYKPITFTADQRAKIKENVDDLLLAIRAASERSSTPHLLCVCPPSPDAVADGDQMLFYDQMEDQLLAALDGISNFYLVKSSELTGAYPVSNYYDPHGNELGHIPYTPAFFTALGSMIARKVHAFLSDAYKIVVLDCDQTLWKGICGEDGPSGVRIDPPWYKLQEFMVKQHDAGKLICLCSKNNEDDVFSVFEYHSEMPLKREHIVSSRINWKPKSENIRSLADELQLGLDSFIFIDDNPVECAEVQANCPEVLTLQLPEDPESIPNFIEHIWAFDHLRVTEEDKKRTALYQQNIERERYRKDSLTLEGFIEGLDLKVNISEPMSHQLTRVSQLTQRTNQFNFTTIRRTEAEVQNICQSKKKECLVAEVSDRFGDYGLVGLIFFETGSEEIEVDTFLVSCRVLGRGVEHRMFSQLGEIAKKRGLDHVRVPYLPTKRNQPALNFLDGIGSRYKASNGEGFIFKFPTEYAEKVTYKPASEKQILGNGLAVDRSAGLQVTDTKLVTAQVKSELLNNIATNLSSIEQIQKIIESQPRIQRSHLAGEYVAPGNDLENSIVRIWQRVLDIDKVGINDNFFEIGGTSLKAVRLIALLRRELDVDISIVSLFESPTVSSMSKAWLQSDGEKESEKKSLVSRKRGEKRRAMKRSRKRSKPFKQAMMSN